MGVLSCLHSAVEASQAHRSLVAKLTIKPPKKPDENNTVLPCNHPRLNTILYVVGSKNEGCMVDGMTAPTLLQLIINASNRQLRHFSHVDCQVVSYVSTFVGSASDRMTKGG